MMHWHAWIQHGGFVAGGVGFLLILFVSFIPIIPIPILATALGAVLSPWWAVFVTWGAASAGAILKFYLVRLILQKQVQLLLERYPVAAKVGAYIEHGGFVAIFLLRLIPVIPSMAINVAAGVTRIPVITFVTATALGKLPTMIAFTVAGHQLRRHPWMSAFIMAVYAICIAYLTWRVQRKLHQQHTLRS